MLLVTELEDEVAELELEDLALVAAEDEADES